MQKKICRDIKELQNTIIMAKLNYEIWWVYKEKESRKRFVDTLNNYFYFFYTSTSAHEVAMIIALYRLFETRRDSVNLPQLINMIKKQAAVSVTDIHKLESEISKIKPLWKKVCILRNKLFAHKSDAGDNETIWKEAKVTPNEFKKLIDESQKILNQLTSLWDKSVAAFNRSSKEDTIRLLEDLKKLNNEVIITGWTKMRAKDKRGHVPNSN